MNGAHRTAAPLLPPELLDATRNRWDAAVEALLAVLLAFMPLAFGAVDAWSELVALGLAAVLTLIVLVRAIVDRTFSLPWTWAYAPLGLMILLIAMQMTPLPQAWVAALSPAAAATRAELLGDDEQLATLPSATLSVYPIATAHGLRLVLLGAAVFFVTVSIFRTAPQIRRLLTIVFVIGCAEAGIALMQIVTHATRMYWVVDVGPAPLTSGSFINYSNFSQFMNLSIGAGVALLLVRLLDDRYGGGRLEDPSRAFGGAKAGDHGAVLAGLVLCAIAVFASRSRNGALSLSIALLVVGVALFSRGVLRRRGWVLAILPLGAFAVMLAFGFDSIYERFATLQENDQFSSRWELTLGVLRAWREFPIWGAGLGAHEYVFPMFDSAVTPVVAGHADNDYAQLLEETGVLGAACVAAFLAIIAWQIVALCRHGRTAISTAAFGLALGLIAVAIHSASDFGQHLPAVFCLSAVSCGLVVSLSRLQHHAAEPQLDQRHIAWRRSAAAALAVVVALGWMGTLRSAYAAKRAEQWWWAARQLEDDITQAGASADDAEYADLLAAAGQAAAIEPHNVEYAYWLNAYRWRSLTRQVDPTTGQALLNPAARPFVERIADELVDARRLCPTYGPPYGLEGQLRLLVLGEEEAGAELIRKGVRLAPYDPPTCLIAGELAARAGRIDEAEMLLQRAATLAPQYYPDVAALALDVLKRPEFVRDLAGYDYNRLQQLASIAAERSDYAEFADELRGDAEAALRRRAADDDASAPDLATLAALESANGNHAAAAELYRRALVLNYDQTDWRFALAQSLVAQGALDQAMREVRLVLRQSPNHAPARQLAEELSLKVSE